MGLDTYVRAVLDALDAVERITGPRAVLLGVCSGGILAWIAAAHLAATGEQDRLAALAAVTVIDYARAGHAGAIVDRKLPRRPGPVKRKGYLDGRALAEVFAWLRPGDLIWNYWVNNYLLGKKPPAFDILFWNADTTRMTAGLHADFVDLAMDNPLVTPGALTRPRRSGRPVPASTSTPTSSPASPTTSPRGRTATGPPAARRRHPLRAVDQRAHRRAGQPADNPKAAFPVNKTNPPDAREWLPGAQTEAGSWWPDFAAWLGDRCGARGPPASPVAAACARSSRRPAPTSSIR